METARKVDLLNRVLHGIVNSVVQYIESAAPYVPAGCEGDLDEILRLKDEEVETANRITAAINDLDGVPKVGVFPYWNVDLNYLDIRFLARFAAEHLEKTIAALEKEVGDVRDDPALHRLLSETLEQKQAHLGALRALGGAAEEPAAKSE